MIVICQPHPQAVSFARPKILGARLLHSKQFFYLRAESSYDQNNLSQYGTGMIAIAYVLEAKMEKIEVNSL